MKILISSNYKKHFNTNINFIDHYWINYFNKKNYEFELIPNSLKIAKKKIRQNKNCDLIIIPGGNDLFKNDYLSITRLKVEKELINYSLKNKIPLLGVCRGMQLLNFYFGGKIEKISGHMKKNTKIFFIDNFFKEKVIKVKCYHNFGIKKKSKSKKFITIAEDKDGNLEMFKHINEKILGVMWHPERESNFKKLDYIFKNFYKK